MLIAHEYFACLAWRQRRHGPSARNKKFVSKAIRALTGGEKVEDGEKVENNGFMLRLNIFL